MEVIVVSGTPGTGKTTFARKLADTKEYVYLDVNKVIDQMETEFDKDKDTRVVDIDDLVEELLEIIQGERSRGVKGLVIDSHMAHYLPPSAVDKVYITKCEIKTLKQRLEERGYSEDKVRENLDAEIFDTCRVEALEADHDVTVVRTD